MQCMGWSRQGEQYICKPRDLQQMQDKGTSGTLHPTTAPRLMIAEAHLHCSGDRSTLIYVRHSFEACSAQNILGLFLHRCNRVSNVESYRFEI